MYQKKNQNHLFPDFNLRTRIYTQLPGALQMYKLSLGPVFVLYHRGKGGFRGTLWKIDAYSDFQVDLLDISYFTYLIIHISHI